MFIIYIYLDFIWFKLDHFLRSSFAEIYFTKGRKISDEVKKNQLNKYNFNTFLKILKLFN